MQSVLSAARVAARTGKETVNHLCEIIAIDDLCKATRRDIKIVTPTWDRRDQLQGMVEDC